MSERKEKIVYLEILRVIAIFGVVLCHTENFGVHHYVETANAVNYWFGIFLASVVQYCIPLFFMISGAVLLDRQESIGYVYRHRVLRMAVVTVLVSLLQYVWNYRGHLDSMDFKGYLRLLYEGNVSGPIWFLFAYLSLLMVLPFLQRLVKAIPEGSWFLYLLAAWILLNDVLAIPDYFLGWNHTRLELPILEQYVLAAVMGYYVEHRSGEEFLRKRNLLILSGSSVFLTLISMWVNNHTLSGSRYVTMGYLFSVVYALTIFALVRFFCRRRNMPERLARLVCFAGAGTFGTYLMEPQLRECFYPTYRALAPVIHAYPAAFVWVGICVLAGILVSNLLKRVPGLGKLI